MIIKDYMKIGKDLVHKAKKLGADEVEVYVLKSKELEIQVVNQGINNIKLAEERGLGIRIFKNKRMGFAFSADLESSALEKAVDQALANAEKTAQDDFLTLAAKYDNYVKLDTYDSKIPNTSVDEKIAIAKEIELNAKKFDPRVKIIERSAYEDAEYEIYIINSLGLEASYQGAYCGGYALVVGEEKGDNQTGFGMQYELKIDKINPQKIGSEAAQKAVRLLGAKSIKSQKAPLILEPYIATNFLGLISSALSADSVQKGKSFLIDKVGKKVASEFVTIIDDGTMEGRIMSSPFDGEGVPTLKTILINDGTLEGYLHNTYTAKKDGVESTGNGVRGSYRTTPEVGTTNFYLAPGTTSPEELIKEIDKGLYVTDVMGMHTANPISGDFSIGASGLWIENGKFSYPVRGVAIAGNLKDLLLNIDKVCNDLTFFISKGSPTIRINNISISGK